MRTQALSILAAVVVVTACGGSSTPAPTNPTPKQSEGSEATSMPASPASTATTETKQEVAPPAASSSATPKTVDVEKIFARVKSDLVACYEQGRKAAPKMTGGKITLHAEVEKDGKTSCVIPADDTGLTQEVEDCMAARVGKETFDGGSAVWTFEMPIIVKDGKITLGEDDAVTAVASILHVEMHNLPDDAHDVAEGLLPKFQQCVLGVEKGESMRVLHVGGRIGKDGRVTCAIATSPTPLSAEVRDCAANALEKTKFPAPKKNGPGLISIPLKLMARRK